MSLPHFSNNKSATVNLDPVYTSLFEFILINGDKNKNVVTDYIDKLKIIKVDNKDFIYIVIENYQQLELTLDNLESFEYGFLTEHDKKGDITKRTIFNISLNEFEREFDNKDFCIQKVKVKFLINKSKILNSNETFDESINRLIREDKINKITK